MAKGKVWLVGAGPGDAGLLTVKARNLIQKAEFIAYDALVGDEILCLLPEETEKVSVGKRSGRHLVPQEEINQILLAQAMKGKRVVRLKGGDPFVFGRGGEELELLRENGIPFEVVPGITSAVAVPAYAGIPVTHREYSSSFHVITGHPRKDGQDKTDYEALVRMNATLVFLMGMSRMETVMDNLMAAGMDKDMPAAVLENGTRCAQRKVVSTVRKLVRDTEKAKIQAPAVIVVGKVCALSEEFAWYENRPLAGRQILVTRARGRAGRLSEAVRDLGAEVLEAPMIKTRLLAAEEIPLEELMLKESGSQCWFTFTSPAGAAHFFEAVSGMKLKLDTLARGFEEMKFAAVGQATAEELMKYGWQTDLVPDVYEGAALGRALADKAKPGAKIFILGAGDRGPGLTKELDEAGLEWTAIPVYETIPQNDSFLSEMLREKLLQGSLDMVTFTSVSTIHGFALMLKGIDFRKVHALCIGPQTAAAARRYGMKTETAEKAEINSMVEKLKELMRR